MGNWHITRTLITSQRNEIAIIFGDYSIGIKLKQFSRVHVLSGGVLFWVSKVFSGPDMKYRVM